MNKPLTETCHKCGATIYNVGPRSALDDEVDRMYGDLPADQTVPICEPCYIEFRAWRDGLTERLAKLKKEN